MDTEPYKLFRVTTDDHDEDWFGVAQDEFQAMDFFEPQQRAHCPQLVAEKKKSYPYGGAMG